VVFVLAGLSAAAASLAFAEGSPSMHMVAQGTLVTVSAPLIVLGARVPSALARPALGWGLFVACQWAFHLPPLFPAALEQRGLRELEHVALFATAVLFWVPAVSRLRGGKRSLYLLAAVPATDLVALWLMASGRPDAGLAMIAGMLPLAVTALVVTWTWLEREERRTRRWEALGRSSGSEGGVVGAP
jgi:cytochrome c oxidase assembly factor CtaG